MFTTQYLLLIDKVFFGMYVSISKCGLPRYGKLAWMPKVLKDKKIVFKKFYELYIIYSYIVIYGDTALGKKILVTPPVPGMVKMFFYYYVR